MLRGWSHKAEAIVLSLVGLMGFIFLLQSNDPPKEEPTATPTAPAAILTPEPVAGACRENASAANVSGFADLPPHIRDFLRYKHCRDFPLILDAADKCETAGDAEAPLLLLLAVKSAPANYERRETIRQTWGRERVFEGVRIRRVFLSGVADADPRESRKLGRLLRLEAAASGDVLQWSFRDTFFNLTLKQDLFHAWLERRCPGARFVFNGDDDVFANTDNMALYVRGLPGGGERHLFVGQLIANVGPIREKWSKYYVPEQVTSAAAYPPYCGGGGVLMSAYTWRAIRAASRGLELFPIDDVFLGMCLRKAGLAPGSHGGIRTVGVRVPSAKMEAFDPCYFRELLLVHRLVPYETRLMWEEIHRPDLVCGRKMAVYPPP